MKTLIVDDERLARVELRRLLEAHKQVEIAGEARSGEEALALIAGLSPELLFLDIQMPGMNGFELLEKVGGDVPQVIFMTAYDEYAVRAFEVNALDYLLKPIAPERLTQALARVRHERPSRLSRIFVRDGERCWIVQLADICLMESEGNYTRLYFGENRPLIRRSLALLEQQLDPALFFRANRRQIVNLPAIEGTALGFGGGLVATLRGGRTVELSRRQSEQLRELLSL